MGYVEKNFEEDLHKVMQIGKYMGCVKKNFEGDSHKVMQIGFFFVCNWGHLAEVSTGSAFEAMSIPFAFQTQAGSRARISHVRNLTKLIMSILSRNFPSGI